MLFQKAKSFSKAHYHALFTDLDAFKDSCDAKASQKQNQKTSAHFLIAFLTFTFFFIEGNFLLQLEYTSTIHLSPIYLQHCPFIMLHQMTPRIMWFQTDMVMLSNSLATFFTLALFGSGRAVLDRQFCYLPFLRKKEVPLVSINDRALSEQESNSILKYSKAGRQAVRLISALFLFLVVYLYCYFNVFIINAVYLVSLHSVWVWAVVFPVHFFYIIFGRAVDKVMI